MNSTMTEYEFKQNYRDMLDECHPVVEIAGVEFSAAEILYNCDRVAYRCGMTDYADALESEGYVILWDTND